MQKYLLCLSVVPFLPNHLCAALAYQSSIETAYEKLLLREPSLTWFSHMDLIRKINAHIANDNYHLFRTFLSFMQCKNEDINKSENMGDSKNYLPLMSAVLHGRTAMVEDLVKAGADITAPIDLLYQTVLHQLMGCEGNAQSGLIANFLVSRVPEEKKKSFINGEEAFFTTPLCRAIYKLCVPNVHFLIQNGVDVNMFVYNGNKDHSHSHKHTALYEVCKRRSDQNDQRKICAIVQLLLDAGADPTIKCPNDSKLPEDVTDDPEVKEMLRNAAALRSARTC